MFEHRCLKSFEFLIKYYISLVEYMHRMFCVKWADRLCIDDWKFSMIAILNQKCDVLNDKKKQLKIGSH